MVVVAPDGVLARFVSAVSQALVMPVWLAAPALSADARGLPSWADVARDPMQGPFRQLPLHAPAWNAGDGGGEFVPDTVHKHVDYWEGVILWGHALYDILVLYVFMEIVCTGS